MHKGRLEAFSDGVIAILITIMVLDLRPPEAATPAALLLVLPVFGSYVLSFVFLGIYWNNHHHMLQVVQHVNGRVLWANMHLLFWLSLVPFVTSWMGEHLQEPWPVALYGFVQVMAALAYTLLSLALIAAHDKNVALAQAIAGNLKSYLSLTLYILAIPLAFVATWLSLALYVTVAVMWFVPDPRIERRVAR